MLKVLRMSAMFSGKDTKFESGKNYYQILQVEPGSTKAQIRNSYLSLAKKYHPDVNPAGQQIFTAIKQAY